MTVKEYVLRRLKPRRNGSKGAGTTDSNPVPSWGVSLNYIRSIRNEWQKASASRRDKGERARLSSHGG